MANISSPAAAPSHTIKETSRMVGVPIHVLRYWESTKLIQPSRTSRGHRRFRAFDIERLSKIKELFYAKGMRLEGVKKALTEESRRKKASQELPLELGLQSAASALLNETKGVLKEILQILK